MGGEVFLGGSRRGGDVDGGSKHGLQIAELVGFVKAKKFESFVQSEPFPLPT